MKIRAKKLGVLCSLLVFGAMWSGVNPASAALPPFYQSQREFKALLELPGLDQKFGSHRPIEEIRRTETGYELVSRNCTLPVEMRYLAQPFPGPIRFDFVVGELHCLSTMP